MDRQLLWSVTMPMTLYELQAAMSDVWFHGQNMPGWLENKGTSRHAAPPHFTLMCLHGLLRLVVHGVHPLIVLL